MSGHRRPRSATESTGREDDSNVGAGPSNSKAAERQARPSGVPTAETQPPAVNSALVALLGDFRQNIIRDVKELTSQMRAEAVEEARVTFERQTAARLMDAQRQERLQRAGLAETIPARNRPQTAEGLSYRESSGVAPRDALNGRTVNNFEQPALRRRQHVRRGSDSDEAPLRYPRGYSNRSASHRPLRKNDVTRGDIAGYPPVDASDEGDDSDAQYAPPPRTAYRPPRFKPEDVGFFDPFLDKAEGEGDILEKGGKIYYRDVYAFAEAAENQARTYGHDTIRASLDKCLRGLAYAWYIGQLTSDQRERLQRGEGLTRWRKALFNQYLQRPAQAFQDLLLVTYGPKDVAAGNPPAAFVLKVLRLTEACGIEKEDRLAMAWSKLDPVLQQQVEEPDRFTRPEEFIRLLDSKITSWSRIYTRTSKYFHSSNGESGKAGTTSERDRTDRDHSRPKRFDDRKGFRQEHSTKNQQTNANGSALPDRPKEASAYGWRNRSKSFPNKTAEDGNKDKGKDTAFDPKRRDKTHNVRVESPTEEPSDEDGAVEEAESSDGGSAESEFAGFVTDHTPPTLLQAALGQTIQAKATPVAQVQPIRSTPDERKCLTCGEKFGSNNSLHRHVAANHPKKGAKAAEAPMEELVSFASEQLLPILESTAKPALDVSAKIRTWTYVKVPVRLTPDGDTILSAGDTGSGPSLIDRELLRKALPSAEVVKGTALRLSGIYGSADVSDVVVLTFYVPALLNGKPTLLKFHTIARVMDDLKAKFLIGMDVIGTEGMIIDPKLARITVSSCMGAVVPIQVRAKPQHGIKRVLKARARTVIPPKTQQPVEFIKQRRSLPADRDYQFEPGLPSDAAEAGATLYHSLLSASTEHVLVRNDSDQPLVIRKGTRLGLLREADATGSYQVDAELATPLAALNPPDSMVDKANEFKLDNGVTIYGDEDTRSEIRAIVEHFPDLFKDKGSVVNVPPERHMRIPVKAGSEGLDFPTRAYKLSAKDRAVIDEKHDKLHQQGKLAWSSCQTPYGFPVFVVWRTITKDGQDTRKARVVVDIRALNAISVKDSYPVPLMDDLIAWLRNRRHISIMDGCSFFFQWPVAEEDRPKLACNSHRGQEFFSVAVMGYINSVQHVQRNMDEILRDIAYCCKAYIDDIVVASNDSGQHGKDLALVFQRLNELNISLEPTKTFLNYPTVTLLGQKVNAFGQATHAAKIEAIAKIKFPATLAAIEQYLGLTGYLRRYVPYYAQLTGPLQDLKTQLLKQAPRQGSERKRFVTKTRVDSTPELLASFEAVQAHFLAPTFLHHQESGRPLYIDVDSSREMGIGAMIYHVAGDPDPTLTAMEVAVDAKDPYQVEATTKWLKKAEHFPHSKVQPLAFYSRALSSAERRYFPTELEMAGLVWVVKKARHMVEAAPATMVFTDHSAVTAITKPFHLTRTNAIDKLNLRLVAASQYLSRFQLKVHYRPGRIHIVPDALSRLANGCEPPPEDANILDEDATYHVTLVEMSDDFKARLKQGYTADKHWATVLSMLQRAARLDEEGTNGTDPVRPSEGNSLRPGLRFYVRDDLIYYRDQDDARDRLCIPEGMEREVFELAHDQQFHSGLQRTLDRVNASFYIRRASRRLRQYIDHCRPCQLNQTKRHAPHGELQPVDTARAPFHTYTLDWIVALPVTSEGFTQLLTVTDKFAKRVCLVPGKDTWGASEWALVLLEAWLERDWPLPATTISDRDKRYLSEMWKTIFGKLNTKICATTAYHPQADGQSERTNQVVEIALRFFATQHQDTDWTEALPYLQASLNNSPNASTGAAPNELLFGRRTNIDGLLRLQDLPIEHMQALRARHLQDAQDAIAFANVRMKERYDARHKPLRLKPGDHVFLRLHHGYKLQGVDNRKLSHQREGPFKVLKAVGGLAYELELPSTMRIHPVISIAHLERAAQGPDPFNRDTEENPGPVVVPNDTEDHWEIERLLKRRHNKRTKATQYLVKWLGYSNAENTWMDKADLDHAEDLVKECDDRLDIPQPFHGAKKPSKIAEAQPGKMVESQTSPEQPRRSGRPRRA